MRASNKVKRDDIFSLIVLNEIYIDLFKVPVLEFKHVQVFENKEIALAFETLNSTPSIETIQKPLFVDIKPGVDIIWDGERWQIANIGNGNLCLTADNKTPIEVPVSFFEQKMKQNRILIPHTAQETENQKIKNLIAGASKDSLKKANFKYDCIQKHLQEGESAESFDISQRTLRRWLKSYQLSEQECGFGYIGLIEKERIGNKNSKIPVETEVCVNEFIDKQYETLKQKKKQEVYNDYELFSKEKGLIPVTLKTFCEKVKQRNKYTQTLKRQGPKAAYKEEPFYWILEPTTPRHGNRPFHIVHMDHTEIDVEMRCSITGKKLGRAYVSKMLDAYSRRSLAKYISFEKPSYRANMMLIRECVKRFNRLPQIIVVDGGKDFSSVYFDTLLAMFECTKKVRPVAKSRFGTVIERVFGTDNTQFFHNLQGNTQITKNVRHVTKSVNPRELSIWNLESLDSRLSEYCYEVYDTSYHSTLGQSPREAFELGMELYGRREFRFISYDETFLMLTLPTTQKEYATIRNDGIKINNIWYWSESFRNQLFEGKKVKVRFDPWNVGVAYVYLNQNWLELYSEYFIELRNRSLKEIELACKEIRARLSLKGKNYQISARKLVEFLRSVENEEMFLTQRLRDLAQRNIIFSNNLILPTQNNHMPFIQGNEMDTTINDSADSSVEEDIIEQESENTEFTPYELIS
ncbi:MAG: transposase family protein [Pyrinomonadaceae bacterium]